jgi:hypothetical protein
MKKYILPILLIAAAIGLLLFTPKADAGAKLRVTGPWASADAPIPRDGLIGEWIATNYATNTGSVAQWTDTSGLGNHFTQSTDANKPLYTSDASGAYLSFDGGNDSMDAAVQPTLPFTIRVRGSVDITGSTYPFTWGGSNSNFQFMWVSSGSLTGGPSYRPAFVNTAPVWITISDTQRNNIDALWVIRMTSGSPYASCIIDGGAVTYTTSTLPLKITWAGGDKLRVGGAYAGSTFYCKEKIRSLRVWNRSLSDAECLIAGY